MLSMLGHIYGKIADLRNLLYDRGIFETFDLGARTISIGNLTTGGTGKTPLVAYVARTLLDRGETVCVLTRGYGRLDPTKRVLVSDGRSVLAGPRQAGDEPFELARSLAGRAVIVADRDRVGAAEWAKRKFGVTAFLLDDGFQHRRVRRDLDVLCIDATEPLTAAEMLPAGRLREPLSNLRRADIVVITRANLVPPASVSKIRTEIADRNGTAAIFQAVTNIVSIVAIDEFSKGQNRGKEGVGDMRAFAFCGLGNPDSFYEQLRRAGVMLVGSRSFRDHYEYSGPDIQHVEQEARAASAEILLTTGKDAVKLSGFRFQIPCFVVSIEPVIDQVREFGERI